MSMGGTPFCGSCCTCCSSLRRAGDLPHSAKDRVLVMHTSISIHRPVLWHKQMIDKGDISVGLCLTPAIVVCDHRRLGMGFGPLGGLGMGTPADYQCQVEKMPGQRALQVEAYRVVEMAVSRAIAS